MGQCSSNVVRQPFSTLATVALNPFVRQAERHRTATLSDQIRSLDTVASECKDLIDRQAARVASLEKELGAVHRRAEKEKEEIMLALSAEQRKVRESGRDAGPHRAYDADAPCPQDEEK